MTPGGRYQVPYQQMDRVQLHQHTKCYHVPYQQKDWVHHCTECYRVSAVVHLAVGIAPRPSCVMSGYTKWGTEIVTQCVSKCYQVLQGVREYQQAL